ncbi:cytochrome P450 76C2 [Cryptomeria japonica]|uniref:cytochrome P450 76C2 n=1 Tax=Cryptomeria japonica TaxID=3369 RepID=UPI0025ABB0B8|nr:cytochrome P450 76C2 [Cryptomeria japonica]
MDTHLLYCYSVLVSSVLVLLSVLLWRRNAKSLPLPPRPPAWPLIGNLFLLGKKPNESLFALSQQYGPLMTLFLGMKTIVVVSSAAMAKEVLKTHDNIFAGRVVIHAAKILSHHKSSIIWAENGSQWRKFRRICTTELFSPKKLQTSQHVRRDSVFQMIQLVFQENSLKEKSVNFADLIFHTGLNMLSNMMFSTKVFDPNNPDSVKFTNALTSGVKLAEKPNLADFFPWLEFLDLHGVDHKMAAHLKRAHHFLDLWISNRLARRSRELNDEREKEKDFLDVLLDLRSHDLSLTNIRAIIFDLLVAGSDTTGATLEWALAELIHNPDKMKKVQVELEEVVGHSRRVEESDIEHLLYLHAVVKEVLRLYPAGPLLIPHRATSSCEIEGFLIPKDTQVWVNVWAIGRDPAVWKEPCKFMPERFLEGEKAKKDFKGQDFEFIPFGAGRRICLGLPLADKMLHFILASLLHSFDWRLPNGTSTKELDMDYLFGVVLKKRQNLQAIPTPRLQHHIFVLQ